MSDRNKGKIWGKKKKTRIRTCVDIFTSFLSIKTSLMSTRFIGT